MAASAYDHTALNDPPVLDKNSLSVDFSSSSTMTEVPVSGLGKTLKIYTEDIVKRNSSESKTAILFLHGMRFSSKNWLDIQSLYHVANWGFRAVAVDLPGYGKSRNTLEDEYNAAFLRSLIQTLELDRPVIVSPSMSGRFSLPFIFEDGDMSMERVLAYIPVAPVGTSQFVQEFKKSQLPTLIVCGTKDHTLGSVSNQDFSNLPNGHSALIQEAGHACYLDNPDAFHRLLYRFLADIM